MKKLDLSFGDGFPLDQDTLKFMETSYFDGIGNLSKAIGDNVILSGCEVVGNTISSGWVIYQNEVMFVQGTTKTTSQSFVFELIYNNTQATYQSGAVYPAYIDKYLRLIASNSASGNVFSSNTFKRIDTLSEITEKVIDLDSNFNNFQNVAFMLLSDRVADLEAMNINGRLNALEAKNSFKIMYSGGVYVGDIPTGNAGLLVNINFAPVVLPHNEYVVIGTFTSVVANGVGSGNLTFSSCNHATGGFTVKINESSDMTQSGIIFKYYVIESLS